MPYQQNAPETGAFFVQQAEVGKNQNQILNILSFYAIISA
jgi:hypothetical protein